MRRPIVGLTCNELDKENLPKQFINEAYINSVIRAGGCPIILPITNDYDTIQAQVNLLDGLIVTSSPCVTNTCFGLVSKAFAHSISPFTSA